MAKVLEHHGGRFEMLHIVKTINSIINRTPLLFGLLFAAVLVLLPISAQAQCTNWDAGGRLNIIQRGADSTIYLGLEQKGRAITGTAGTTARPDGFLSSLKRSDAVDGTVDGTIDGDSFSIQIFWPDGLTGV